MKKYIADFREIIKSSYGLLSNLSKVQSRKKKNSKKWSSKEILGHLIDSAVINSSRILSSLEKDDLIFSGYPQDKYVRIQKYEERDWHEMLELWRALNLHIAELSMKIPKTKLERKTLAHNFDQICWKPVESGEKSNLSYLIKDYIGHLNHHLKQILENQRV